MMVACVTTGSVLSVCSGCSDDGGTGVEWEALVCVVVSGDIVPRTG